jgi:protein tyrosine phosphatase
MVDRNLWVMDKHDEHFAEVDAVVNLSPTTPQSRTDVEYHRVPDTTRTSGCAFASLAGYEDARAFLEAKIAEGLRVGVHCNAGYQRTVPFVAYCLMSRGVEESAAITRALGYEDSNYTDRVMELFSDARLVR